MQDYVTHSESDSKEWAYNFACKLKAGDIVTFTGELGAGKTFICREIIKYYCGQDTYVSSPTFNLLQTYQCNEFIIYHFDLYRLKHEDEIYELGIEDALNNNLCLIEWSEIIEHILPKQRINILLERLSSDSRSISLI